MIRCQGHRERPITIGLPFTLVLIAMCVSLYMGLTHELRFAGVVVPETAAVGDD